MQRLKALYPGTSDDALRLVLAECHNDVERSVALIDSLLLHQRPLDRRRQDCRVVRSWTARSERELSATRGETLHAVEFLDDGVWAAHGRRCVPAACVRPLTDDVIAVALRDYDAAGKPGHLSFRRDERLLLLSRIAGYDWWYAQSVGDESLVGRVPITLLRVVQNVAVFEAAERQGACADAAAVLPSCDPPPLLGGDRGASDCDGMDDALTDDDDDDDPLFSNAMFVEAEQHRRRVLSDGDESVESAMRDLLRATTTLRRSGDDSTSSDDSLRLNAAQAALLRKVLKRLD